MLVAGVAAAADLGREFNARNHRRIVRIGRMVAGRPVAVLALHPLELWGLEGVRESGRQAVTDRMAGQTTGFVS